MPARSSSVSEKKGACQAALGTTARRQRSNYGQVVPDRVPIVAAVLSSKAKLTEDRQRQRTAADTRTETEISKQAYRWPCWNCWQKNSSGNHVDTMNEQERKVCYSCSKGKPGYLNALGRDIRWICPN